MRLTEKQPQQVRSMAEFSPFPFEPQAQLSGRSKFFRAQSASTQTCLPRLKNDTVPKLLVVQVFYLMTAPLNKAVDYCDSATRYPL